MRRLIENEQNGITIRLDAMRATVAGCDEMALAPLLQDAAWTFDSGPDGVCGRRQEFSLGRTEAGDYCFAAKLAWWVGSKVQKTGRSMEIVRPRTHRMVTPNPAITATLPEPLSTLFERGLGLSGLIRFTNATHPHLLVPHLIRAYPTARVIVAVPNRGQIRGWIERLRAGVPNRTIVASPLEIHSGTGEFPVTVITLNTLDHCQVYHGDLVIVPDARPLLSVDARLPDLSDSHAPRDYRLLRHWHIPAFGFLPGDHPQSRHEERRLRALFGHIYDLSAAVQTRVQVTTVTTPRPSTIVPDPEADPVGYKRAAIWENSRRNRFIVKLARQRQQQSASDSDRNPVGKTPRIAILVEVPSHAHRPAAQLPAWAVLQAESADIESLTPQPDRAVMTEVWAANQRTLPFDVLIDARGWNSLALPGFPPADGATDGVVELIDIVDRIPHGAARKARKRAESYRDRGWIVANTTEPNSV